MANRHDLVERYLQAVKFWLPKTQREDIAAELSEDLHARIEEREITLGRTMHEEEIVAMLRESGAPVLVAGRYRPQQSLIGPVLFPVYLFVLKIVAFCYLVPWLFSLVGFFNPMPAPGSVHSGISAAAFGNSITSAFISFGVVTLVFAVIERVQAKIPALHPGKPGLFPSATWDPCRLPTLRDPWRIPRSSSIAEIVVNLVFAIWWVSGSLTHTIFDAFSLRIVLSGQWSVFYWGFLILALLNIASAVFNLLRPYWTKERALLRLALDAAGSGLFCWLLKARTLLEISAPSLSSARAAEIVHTLNAGIAYSFPFAVLICILVLVLADAGRLMRLNTSTPSGVIPLGHHPSV